MTIKPLEGIGVLITRPDGHANELISEIEDIGGHVINLPAINIVPRNKAIVEEEETKLPEPDITIFISQNAVKEGLQYARKSLIGAIGPKTSACIKSYGKNVDIEPTNGFDSENFLKEAHLQNVYGKNIRIIRGNEGLNLLGDTLQKRGATVHYLSVYERNLPNIEKKALEKTETAWRNRQIHIMTAMSVQTYKNIFLLLSDELSKEIGSTPLVTPAKRVIEEARKNYPQTRYALASGTDNAKIIDAIIFASKLRS